MDNYINSIISQSLSNLNYGKTNALGAVAAGREPQIKDEAGAAKEFEAMFMAQMLRPMFDTVKNDGPFNGGHAEKIWRDMLVEEYGKSVSDRGSMGVSEALRKEFVKLQEVQEEMPNEQ